MTRRVLALRLAGPLQAWSATSRFNRRETDLWPTKSGVLGLLAAAQGLRRGDSIEQLLGLALGIRADQPGKLLRDYHTISTLTGDPLLSAATNSKGTQKATSPKKFTSVTERFYLQDACFVVAVEGPADFVNHLAHAVSQPAFPLYLGRRSCVLSRPPLIREGGQVTWDVGVRELLERIPWQGRLTWPGQSAPSRLPVVCDLTADTVVDEDADVDERIDVPISFAPSQRGMMARRVVAGWVEPPGLGTPAVAGTGETPPNTDTCRLPNRQRDSFNDFELLE